jgi:D-alanyl-D-alanine carboxypeptidase
MTAIVALENKKSGNSYRVLPSDLVGENTMGLSAGEVLTLEELLYGLLLPSGNDAAEVLARNYPEGREAFINAMNNKAKALGLTDTHFTNPSGLQGDGEQYTTAYDLLVITRYAIEHFPKFTEITSTYEYVIPATTSHKEYYLYNETNLISSYEGVKGVKTGYTPEAGMCLVTYLEYGGQKIIGVILNSEDRRGEMKEMLDYSLRTVGITPHSMNNLLKR